MKTMTRFIVCVAAGSVVSLSGCDTRDNSPASGTSATPSSNTTPSRNTNTTAPNNTNQNQYDADNTGRNQDDRDQNGMTPIDQSQSSEHISITSDIRRAVVDDDMLSMNAKNCKIITDDSGRVWLRGPVSSQAEKDRIENIAQQIAGARNVTNELEVKTG